MLVRNQTSRYHLVIEALRRAAGISSRAAPIIERYERTLRDHRRYIEAGRRRSARDPGLVLVNVDGHILVLNAGSSSLKLGLFDATGEEQLAERQMSWDVDAAPGYQTALRHVVSDIDVSRVTAVGHRVVHGGARFTAGVADRHGHSG